MGKNSERGSGHVHITKNGKSGGQGCGVVGLVIVSERVPVWLGFDWEADGHGSLDCVGGGTLIFFYHSASIM